MATTIAPIASTSRSQYQVQNALRQAQQAEQTAQNLRSQADAAQRSADKEQQRADVLGVRASDASARSDNARDALDLAHAQSQNNVRLLPKLPQVPFVNPAGQATGLIVSAIA